MPNLPGIGKVSKGWVVAVGGGSVLVLGYVWYKHSKANAAAAASTSSASTTPDPNAIDPATGMTYAEEEALAQSASGYGAYGYSPYGGYGGGYGGGSGQCYDQYGNPIPCGGGGGGGNPPGPGSFTNNAQWASYVEQNLAGIIDPTTLSAAIGVYLVGRPATTDQVNIIDQAIAIGGYPPVAGPGGNPPGIVPGGSGPPGPPPPGGNVPVPNVVGQNWSNSIKQITAAGLVPSPSSKPSNAKDPITGENPAAGTQVAKGSTVALTSPHR